jgi:beta-phosphoglucomutase-like phosphatase (HAD superfamily)
MTTMHPDLHPGEASFLLFDWDGTLVDSQPNNYRAMATTLAEHGLELAHDWFASHTGLSSADLIEALVAETGHDLPAPVADLVQRRDLLFLENVSTVRPHPAVAAVVASVEGTVPMAIASGGARHVIEHALRHQPFSDAFAVIVTRDDVQRGKPEPDIFLAAAQRFGAAPAECLVYEDSDEGMSAAHAAGMRVIDVRPYTVSD